MSFLVESQCSGYDPCFHKLISWWWNNWHCGNPDEEFVEWTSISSSSCWSLLHNPSFPPADPKKHCLFMFWICFVAILQTAALYLWGGQTNVKPFRHSRSDNVICRMSLSEKRHELFRKIRDKFVINWRAQTPPFKPFLAQSVRLLYVRVSEKGQARINCFVCTSITH